MGNLNIRPTTKAVKIKGVDYVIPLCRVRDLRKFNSKVLGLGSISTKSRMIDALAAVFDLSGFTTFCGQTDPHLSMPDFLQRFLDWLFGEIKKELSQRRFRQGVMLRADLPFFAKFTGDGVLFLWNTENMEMKNICNILVALRNVSNRYSNIFVPVTKKDLSDIPKSLRCGAARGIVCTVGNGEDYVGSCINIASRLQKLSSLQFCFLKKGIDYEDGMVKETACNYAVKSVKIRGVGRNELVVIRIPDFEKLGKRDRAIFKDV